MTPSELTNLSKRKLHAGCIRIWCEHCQSLSLNCPRWDEPERATLKTIETCSGSAERYYNKEGKEIKE